MVEIGQKEQDEITKIRHLVESAYVNNKDNIELYEQLRKFVFITSLSDDARIKCQTYGWPQLEANTIEAFLSRLSGEFAKQMPSPAVRARNDFVSPEMIDFTEGRLRYTFESVEMDNIKKSVYLECLSGGMSSVEAVYDYIDNFSFDKCITFEKTYDPTLVFFDPMSRKNHKGDGMYCFQLCPMTRSTFEQKYSDFNLEGKEFSIILPTMMGLQVPWFVKEASFSEDTREQEILYICDFFEKRFVDKKLVRINMPDGQPRDMLKDDYETWAKEYTDRTMLRAPEVKDERDTLLTEIWHHKFVKDQYLEKTRKTVFHHLPIVNFDGNGQIIGGKCHIRGYGYHATGSQKFANMALIAMANGIDSMNNTQFLMAEESMPTAQAFKDGWTNPNKQQGVIVYKAWPQTNQATPNPAPIVIPKSSFDPVLLQARQAATVMQQECMGNFQTQLGMNKGDITNLTFEESVTQSNAAAMPYINNFMDSLNQLALIYVDLLPICYKTPQSVPIISKDGEHVSVMINDPNNPKSPMIKSYNSLDLSVNVKSSVNFDVQKDRALEVIQGLMKLSPVLAEFFGQGKGLPALMDNIDIRGQEAIKKNLMEFMEQKAQAAQEEKKLALQTNPEVVKMQIASQEAKLKQMELMLQAQEMKMQEQIEGMKLQQAQLEALAKIRESNAKIQMTNTRAEAEQKSKEIEQAIAVDKHLTDKIENDREHLAKMLDLSVANTHNKNKHHHAMTKLAHDVISNNIAEEKPEEVIPEST